jgi:hypothetical protein
MAAARKLCLVLGLRTGDNQPLELVTEGLVFKQFLCLRSIRTLSYHSQ